MNERKGSRQIEAEIHAADMRRRDRRRIAITVALLPVLGVLALFDWFDRCGRGRP